MLFRLSKWILRALEATAAVMTIASFVVPILLA